MCGIAGFNWNDNQLLQSMVSSLHHRGPDDRGFFEDNNISLGQTRLSIIDLDSGKQPISNEDESIWVILNGEIYNYKELRIELEQKHHQFKTNSDTEVLVHAYEEYGDSFVSKLNGMFALAIWDSIEKKIFLARDRIGIKPLLYHYNLQDNKLIFASEQKAILQNEKIKRALNKSALTQFLTYAYTVDGTTLFQGVNELLPGHYLVFQKNELKINQYWDLPNSMDNIKNHYDESYYAKTLREKLEKAVKYRMISDVPVGAFLSGGVDSSIIVALMSKYMPEKMNTFCIGFNDPSDELKYARIVAEHCNTNHHEVMINFSDVVKNMGNILWHMEVPYARPSAACLYFLSKEAKKKVTVIPVGEGADELFGGYNRDIPSNWQGNTVQDKANGIMAGYWKENEKREVFSSEINNSMSEKVKPNAFFSNFLSNGEPKEPELNGALKFETKTELPGLQLFRSDRMSMASAIETRVPFLDHEVVEFAMDIPSQLKVNPQNKKHILRVATKDLLPNEILHRVKWPFGMPQERFYNEELKDVVQQVLSSQSLQNRKILNEDYLTKLKNLMNDRNSKITAPLFRQLWFLTNLELWHRMFIDSEHSKLKNPELDINKLI
jgi:asparagine synthase (glutamine-hydrolysing)